jgi:flagellar biosynthesis protein FlhA
VETARFEFMPGHELAIAGGPPQPALDGKPTVEPAFGLPAVWVATERSEYAQSLGYTVVDALSVIGTHFTEVVKRHAHELLTRQDAKAYCDRIAPEQPKLVDELVSKHLVVVQHVLQNLLREQVPVRDATTVLEAMSEALLTSRNAVLISEYVRQQIRRLLVAPYVNANGELAAYLAGAELERTLEGAIEHGDTNSLFSLAPERAREIVQRLQASINRDEEAVLVSSPGVRYFLRQLTEVSHPNLTVLSQNENPPTVTVVSLGAV